MGDVSKSASKITFLVPNLKDITEELVRWEPLRYERNRVSFQDQKFSINLEKNAFFTESKDLLQNTGGYCIQYYGEIIKESGEMISYSEAIALAQSLSTFLSFINGARTSILFLTGLNGQEIVWQDNATNIVDRYKPVSGWFHKEKSLDIKVLWKNFRNLWKAPKHRDNLKNVISFYLESNYNKVFIENCIVLTQAAMELLYNWQFVEQGDGDERDSAELKINKLVGKLKISTDIPDSLQHLKRIERISFNNKLSQPRINITSATEAFLEIRNAIIHGNKWRRENLKKIDDNIRIDAWILGNWYIELSILQILNYNGLYNNRTLSIKNGYASMQPVPWVIDQ